VSGVGVHVGIGEEGRGGPAQWSAAAPDRWAWAVVLLREKGRVAVHGRRGTRATDRRGRAATGPVVSGGVRERVRESGGSTAMGADRRARQHSAGRVGFKLSFKPIQKYSTV
jgi:hypothetical protein